MLFFGEILIQSVEITYQILILRVNFIIDMPPVKTIPRDVKSFRRFWFDYKARVVRGYTGKYIVSELVF